jgi:hypothetical protein
VSKNAIVMEEFTEEVLAHVDDHFSVALVKKLTRVLAHHHQEDVLEPSNRMSRYLQ